MTYALAIHGGAGPIPGGDFDPQITHLRTLIAWGRAMLVDNETALDVVTAMVVELEKCGLYMAGRGCSPNLAGTYELDASIMNGSDQQCGAVMSLQGIKHPILGARAVMENTKHIG
ncbi:MAG: isoaspartyl peptidase/L-asparaginase [Pseudomonadota bacterium]